MNLKMSSAECRPFYNIPKVLTYWLWVQMCKFQTQLWDWYLHCSNKHCPGMKHYNDVIMRAIVSQITSLTIVYSTINSGADQRKPQSAASLAFVQGIHRWLGNSMHQRPVTRKMFPFDDVIMMPKDLVDGKSTQVIAWYCQATSHYLNQCWTRFMLPYGTTRPQRVKSNHAWFKWNHKTISVHGQCPKSHETGQTLLLLQIWFDAIRNPD